MGECGKVSMGASASIMVHGIKRLLDMHPMNRADAVASGHMLCKCDHLLPNLCPSPLAWQLVQLLLL